MFISIHAPTRGATVQQYRAIGTLEISIHAPTRGATCKECRLECLLRYFNPRSYKRSDIISDHLNFCTFKFQSTLLQEERHSIGFFSISACIYFNPRSYKRSDFICPIRIHITNNFNPRSYKRSDMLCDFGFVIFFDFNPRSYKRSDVLNLDSLS